MESKGVEAIIIIIIIIIIHSFFYSGFLDTQRRFTVLVTNRQKVHDRQDKVT